MNSKYWFITQNAIIALITYSLMTGSSVLMNVAVIFSAIYIFFADYTYSFLFLLAITVFENAFKFNGILAWFFLVVIVLVKYIMSTQFKIKKKSTVGVIAFILLLLIELLDDTLNYGINGQMLTTIALILYFAFLFSDQVIMQLDERNIVLSLGTSFFFAIIYLLNQYGGLTSFISKFMTSSYAYRFGHSYGDTIGGAMGIPIYSLLIISFSVIILLKNKSNTSMISNLYILFLNAISIVFGALTISRSFYVGLAIIVVLFFMGKSEERANWKKILFILVGAIVAITVFRMFSAVINQTFDNLFMRIDMDAERGGTGIRTQIWQSAFEYLFEHPIGILFGFGSNGYQLIGQNSNMLFSAGTHNLFIDIIMSWGVVGSICVLALITDHLPIAIGFKCARNWLPIILPIITLIIFCLTAMRTNSIKTFIYLFACISIIKRYDIEELEDE